MEIVPRVSAALLIIMLLVVFYTVITLLSTSHNDTKVPHAINGELNISSIDLANRDSLPLSGDWAFYWGKLLSPQQLSKEQNSINYIHVPHAWVRAQLNDQPLPSTGSTTYQLTIKTDKYHPQLALKIPTIGTAYKLWINDTLLAKGGQVATSAANSHAQYNPQTLFFNPEAKEFTLTIQVSNNEYYWGGIWTSLRLGSVDALIGEQNRELVRYAFIVAIFLTVAIINLMQFTLNTKDTLPIFIAITCILFALRGIEISQILTHLKIASWSFTFTSRINILTFYMMIPTLGIYFQRSFPDEFNQHIMRVIYSISGIACLLVLLTPPAISSQSVIYFQVFALATFPYVIWNCTRAIKNKRTGARLLMVGTIFLLILGINDILYSLDLLNTTLMSEFGFVAFILCQNYITYIRFIDTGIENRYLSKTLEERNKELEEFSLSLEEKVHQRTDQLAEANLKLQKIAAQDMLTQLPNRRGMMPFIEQSMVHFKQSASPFCLLLVDFDKFKQVNDLLGHDAGDQVLKEGAQIIRSSLREQDKISRWGGEEFLILLPNTPISGAMLLANKIRVIVHQQLSERMSHSVSITIGITDFREDDTFETSLKRADLALYQGKNNGRNRIELIE